MPRYLQNHAVAAAEPLADLDGLGEHRADRGGEPFAVRAGQSARLTPRTDAGAEQRLAGVDVADTDHHLRIHDELFDRHTSFTRGTPQRAAVEAVLERFRAEMPQQRMLCRVALDQMQRTEATRVVESQRLARVKLEVEVVVRETRCIGG
jgi:hypothetical protein